jgi:hypothetical protein
MEKIFKTIILLLALAGPSLNVCAQEAVPPPMSAYQPLDAAQLSQLLGPVALYPDPLIAQILPASTFPTEIVMADRYVSGGGDPNALDQQPWDPSVQALARYPQVLQWMDQNLGWTTQLGQAFLNQQQDVMDAIQQLRLSAYNLGNLQSSPDQQVINDGGEIEILPADPDTIYVPVYQPDEVYYQAGFGITFGVGCPIGIWLDGDFDWHHHHLVVWGRDHAPPEGWWRQGPAEHNAFLARQTEVWHPENHPGNARAGGGDRGWNNQLGFAAPRQTVVRQPEIRQPAVGQTPVRQPAVQNRPVPAAVQHNEPIHNPASNGAFIGIQSSQEARAYSERGQQSMPAVTRPAPEVHSAPAPESRPAPSSGGGGAGGVSHGGGSPRR